MPPPVVKNPAAPKKRPKYAPGSGTPIQRALMLAGVVICAVLIFVLPSGTDEDDEFGGDGSAAAKPPKPVQPETIVNEPVPVSGAVSNFKVASPVDPSVPSALSLALPPVSEVTQFSANTPEEIDQRISTLSSYFLRASQKDKNDAVAALCNLEKDMVARLPKLIATCETDAVVYYAVVAEKLKAENCTDAILGRLNAKLRPPGMQQLLQALASFSDPKATQYILGAIKGNFRHSREIMWSSLGRHFTPEQRDAALQIVAEGKAEASMAAAALGRYGTSNERASELMQRVDPLLRDKTGPAKVALIELLSGINSEVSGLALSSAANDFDPRIRAAAMVGLARNPNFSVAVINALKTDPDQSVKKACIGALAANPTDEVIGEFVKLMDDPALKGVVHPVLVRINKGKDLGKFSFNWKFWYSRSEYKDPADRPKITVKVADDKWLPPD